ncbi:MAG: hypothetical protein ACKOWL_02355 [Sphingobacteriaceae bacterium]
MRKNLAFAFFIFTFTACQQKESSPKQTEYIDLQGFFSVEAKRLNKIKPKLLKTVGVNENREQQLLSKSVDWEKELSVFKEADINKPAFKGMYQISRLPGKTLYTALSKKALVQRVEIDWGLTKKPIGIRIFQVTKNIIYQSTDTLSYYPDSVYSIHKKQVVRVLGTTFYTINGKFN